MIRRQGKKLHRRAAAAVEMAVVTPILVTMLFGIIEFGYAFTVKQSIATAAREGARLASMPGSTEQEVRDRVDEIMSRVGVTGSSVVLTRASEGNPTEEVRVEVPYEDISLLGGYFGDTNFNLKSTCSMRKEGLD
jgi:hypothetical protein